MSWSVVPPVEGVLYLAARFLNVFASSHKHRVNVNRFVLGIVPGIKRAGGLALTVSK